MSCLGPRFYDAEDGACLVYVLVILKMVCVLNCPVGHSSDEQSTGRNN